MNEAGSSSPQLSNNNTSSSSTSHKLHSATSNRVAASSSSSSSLDPSSYFDINDFNASAQSINVLILRDIKDELLLINGKSNMLKNGTICDLPIWMALFLAKRKLVKIILPDFLQEVSSDAFTLGQSELDLNKFTPNFYRTLNVLRNQIDQGYYFKYRGVLPQRIDMLLSLSLSDPNHQENRARLKTLDNQEKEIVNSAREALSDFKEWH